MKSRPDTESSPRSGSDLPDYEPPQVRLLDEEEILSSFQITQAGYSWWIYGT